MNIKIPLDYPITCAGVQVSELTVRRAKMTDMVAAKKAAASEVESEVLLFANLCQVTPAEIMQLDMKDYKKIQAAFEGFLS